MIRIASFDIGMKSFAEFVCELPVAVLDELKEKYRTLAKHQKYVKFKRDAQSPEYKTIIESLVSRVKRVYCNVVNLRDDEDHKQYTEETRENMVNHLFAHAHVYDTCDHVIVEQQMSAFGSKNPLINMNANRIAETVRTWFTIRNIQRLKKANVEYVPSTWKTDYLGAPAKLNYSQRKKWSVDMYFGTLAPMEADEEIQLLYEHACEAKGKRKRLSLESSLNESFKSSSQEFRDFAVRMIVSNQKLDDIADSHNQLIAWILKSFIINN